MADADVPITAGTGTKIDTRTVGAGTDEHRQVVVVGDPTTAANVAAVQASAPAGTEQAVVTRPIPSGTQTVSGTVTANLAAGTNNIGDVDVLTLPSIPAGANQIGTTLGPTITKGTQGATGYTVQDLKDAGRNLTNFHMTIPVVTTATDALQSLTGYKSNAAVAATTTPAVVTAGKTLRIVSVTLTYVAIATAGSAKFTLRANTAGVVAIGSPVVQVWVIGGPAAVAGVSQSMTVPLPDGMEFAAGTGIGVSMVGLSATQAAAAVGYGQIALSGFEY